MNARYSKGREFCTTGAIFFVVGAKSAQRKSLASKGIGSRGEVGVVVLAIARWCKRLIFRALLVAGDVVGLGRRRTRQETAQVVALVYGHDLPPFLFVENGGPSALGLAFGLVLVLILVLFGHS